MTSRDGQPDRQARSTECHLKRKLFGADHIDDFIPLENNKGEYCPEEVLQIWSVRRKKSSEDPLPEVEHVTPLGGRCAPLPASGRKGFIADYVFHDHRLRLL